MATRRVIKSILHNFLGTLTSRYSDWHGQLLFGFIVEDLKRLDQDLLIAIAGAPHETPMAYLRSLATRRFHEQLSKAGLDPTCIRQATLSIERLPGTVEINYPGIGYRMRFVVGAITDLGKAYECEDTIAVAPYPLAH